jgi:heme-degrading monooxygenase HmoA
MIYEIAIQTVDPARRDNYIKVFSQTLKDANYAGSHGIKFFTSIEDPSRVVLILERDSVEAHTQHRGTPTPQPHAGDQFRLSDGQDRRGALSSA